MQLNLIVIFQTGTNYVLTTKNRDGGGHFTVGWFVTLNCLAPPNSNRTIKRSCFTGNEVKAFWILVTTSPEGELQQLNNEFFKEPWNPRDPETLQ